MLFVRITKFFFNNNELINILENEAIRDSRCMYDDDYFLWFKGGNILSVVNVNTFEFEDLDMIKGKYINFF